MSDTIMMPKVGDPTQERDRMAHIIFEGYTPEDGEFVAIGNCVVDGIVNGTPVKALCGKIWVPSRNPKNYPICPTCREIAQELSWSLPDG